jgi:hypothetical protein
MCYGYSNEKQFFLQLVVEIFRMVGEGSEGSANDYHLDPCDHSSSGVVGVFVLFIF